MIQSCKNLSKKGIFVPFDMGHGWIFFGQFNLSWLIPKGIFASLIECLIKER